MDKSHMDILDKLLDSKKFFTPKSTRFKARLSVNRCKLNEILTEEELAVVNQYGDMKTFVYAVGNGIPLEEVKCPYCGNPKKIIKGKLSPTCGSSLCKGKAISATKKAFSKEKLREIKDKHLKYYAEHYGEGITNPMQVEAIRLQAEDTMKKRYGVSHALQSKEIKAKAEATTLKHYGVDNPFQSEEIKDKCRKSTQKHYGVDYYTQTEEWRNRREATSLEKYGTRLPPMNADVQRKQERTKLTRYGDAYFANLEKGWETKLNRYGDMYFNNEQKAQNSIRESYSLHHDTKDLTKEEILLEAYRENNRKAFESNVENHGGMHNFCTEEFKELKRATIESNRRNLLESLDWEEKGMTLEGTEVVCNTCHERYQLLDEPAFAIRQFQCPKCHPYEASNCTSNFEYEVETFLMSLGVDFECNRMYDFEDGKKQLDFYVPSARLGIECDGLYWHSSNNVVGKPKNYHLDKTKAFESMGIQCIHIFESEWRDSKAIVKDILRRHLNKTEHSYARLFELREVDNADYRTFVEENHIQGYAPASVRYGLYKNGKPYAMMSFSKARYTDGWEMIRFCERLGCHIVGGKARLLKAFERSHEGRLISYCDKRYFNGKSYEDLGFTQIRESQPSYWYWKGTSPLMNRLGFQKHKLKGILENFDENLSEIENMTMNGYRMIYDCGQKVFEKKL